MTRRALLAVALILSAQVAAPADRAGSRDGSRSSGHGSDAGARHHGTASSSSGSDHGSGGGGSSARADLTPAQQRHPRAGTGTGDRFGHYGGYHHGGYGYGGYGYGGYGYGYRSAYFGFGYYPYNSLFYFGYPAYYYNGYYGYDPYYYARPYGPGYSYGYRDAGSLRVIVDPEKTRVYVDGYYAGIADDFDGMFQRLNISPGRHEITLKLEGYRTHRFRVYVPVEHTLKLHYAMVRGSGDDPEETVGEPDLVGRPAGYARLEDEERDERRGGADDARAPRGDAGTLRLDIRPSDASVYVDGAFRGTARELDRLPLAPGRHHIEMVRPGFRTVERDVEIRPGETSDLSADLERS